MDGQYQQDRLHAPLAAKSTEGTKYISVGVLDVWVKPSSL
ncbi:Uncharacterised protein [Mycobacteroides abscessus subsp. abscessus]|nr:Uncharacterised protein [Mycobacteroides abscessus subsp. abscessus]